ncbi:hypothetical protein ABPG72_015599 [Tetrahymena utriculariae]
MNRIYINNNYNNNNIFKILFCGNSFVGKTCLIKRLHTNNFHEKLSQTIGIDFTSISYNIDNKNCLLRLLDTTGQNKYSDLILQQARDVDGVVFVYDISDMNSFQEIENWQKKIQTVSKENIQFTLIGNKCDLQDRQVPKSKGLEYAESNSMNFFETSAKDGKDISKTGGLK